jgi:hypothetical protein
MLGAAALLVTLTALAGQPPAGAWHPVSVHVRSTPDVKVLVVPEARASRLRSCSAQRSQPGTFERKLLPVACEQPPRSQLTPPPNGIVLFPLVGG